jgi:hypothetical protein
MPSPWTAGAKAPVVCHGRPPSELNLGCTDERLLRGELLPVGDWLRQHPGDVVLLYVEDAIDEPAGYDAAAKQIKNTIGDLVYRPPAGPSCPLLPMALRRGDVLAAHKQVVIMSGCGSGSAAWGSTVFDDSVRAEEGNPDFDSTTCTSPSVGAAAYGTKLVRFYEDSTFVSAAVSGGDPGHRLTVDTIEAMVRCGVNLFGLDQVDPGDPRLAAMVWSWAQGEPATSAAGTCAFDGNDERFHAAACESAAARSFACVDPATGVWSVTATTGRQGDGSAACAQEHPGSLYAVPASGAHASRLRAAKAAAGVGEVWLAYAADGSGAWVGAPA